VGTDDGRLLALGREDGHLRWSYDAGAGVPSSPAVAGGVVYVESRDGAIHAVSATTGRRIWRVSTGPDLPYPWGHESGERYFSSPAVAGGLMIVGAGDGDVYALTPATGAIRWRGHTEGRVRGSPAVADGKVVVGSYDGRIYAFALRTGKRLWRYDTEGTTLFSGNFGYDRRSIQSSPAISDGTVFVGARDGFLYAVDLATGALKWRFDHHISWIIGSPAVTDGMLYVGSSDAAFLQAVDAGTGQERWRTPLNDIVWSSPVASATHIYVGDGVGRFDVVDRKTGRVVTAFRTGAAVISSPTVAGHLAFVGSSDGGVYAFRLAADPARAVHRAVVFDSAAAAASAVAQPKELSQYLAHRGYTLLDTAGTNAFLAARIADHRPSVVVFTVDVFVPALLRQYLEAGGKVVWLGIPPALWPLDAKSERGSLLQIQWDAPTRLLGVPHDRTIFDARGVRATAAGERWGLSGHWRGAWAVDPRGVTEVLGRDDWGLASAWVKNYGGPEGTGFVRVDAKDFLGVLNAAEFRPEPGE
jgi:outer membrane protein assembly factor BamB